MFSFVLLKILFAIHFTWAHRIKQIKCEISIWINENVNKNGHDRQPHLVVLIDKQNYKCLNCILASKISSFSIRNEITFVPIAPQISFARFADRFAIGFLLFQYRAFNCCINWHLDGQHKNNFSVNRKVNESWSTNEAKSRTKVFFCAILKDFFVALDWCSSSRSQNN